MSEKHKAITRSDGNGVPCLAQQWIPGNQVAEEERFPQQTLKVHQQTLQIHLTNSGFAVACQFNPTSR